MKTNARIVLVALAAAVLGAGVGLWSSGPSPLLRTEWGQRLLQGAASATAPPPPAGVTIAGRGDAMPALELPDLGGGTLSLPGAYAGRPILINFWASWCGPCIEEMPELDRFASTQGASGTQVVGIALDDAEAVQAFLQRIPVRYPIALDRPGPSDSGVRLGNARGVLPYTVLVDRSGRIAKQKIGPFAHGEIEGWVGRIQTVD